MPFIPNTPESLLRRADSKNPASTCKGITTSGVHCRRSIVPSRSSIVSFSGRRSRNGDDGGVLALLKPGDGPEDEGAAAFFCWQHKDQAVSLTNAASGNRLASIVELKSRTSQDTLVERLGILNVESDGKSKSKKQSRRDFEKEKPARKDTLPKNWQDVDGPLLAVHEKRGQAINQPRRRKDASFLSALCCLSLPDIDEEPPARPRHYREKPRPAASFAQYEGPSSRPSRRQANDTTSSHNTPNRASHASPIHQTPPNPMTPTHRPRYPHDPPSETQTLLSLVPKTLSPQTTSALLAELAKPISSHDEPGYIYIFWLTASTNPLPNDSEVLSFLDKNERLTLPTTPRQERTRAENMSPDAAGRLARANNTTKILLKIGRASNVQRRMNEWSRQCGYNLSLVRFYPYISSSSSQAPSPLPSPSRKRNNHLSSSTPSSPSKVPCAQKVERLIHLELADMRVKRDCESCGRCHQEWFEVPKSRVGVGMVDDIVRRWVGWGERARH